MEVRGDNCEWSLGRRERGGGRVFHQKKKDEQYARVSKTGAGGEMMRAKQCVYAMCETVCTTEFSDSTGCKQGE